MTNNEAIQHLRDMLASETAVDLEQVFNVKAILTAIESLEAQESMKQKLVEQQYELDWLRECFRDTYCESISQYLDRR